MVEYLDSRESVLYGDFSGEFGDYVCYLAAGEGPTSDIDMQDSRVSVTEADVAIASHLGRKVDEAEDVDVRNLLESGVESAATIGFTGKFLASGDPAWLSPAVILGYLAKEDVVEAYDDLRSSWAARRKKSSSVSEFRREYPGIDSYSVVLDDIDEDAAVSAVRPEDMGEELQDVLGDKAFQ
jgi:hypothetical protein